MSRRLAPDVINSFVEDLRTSHGENLASVLLYGSAINGKEPAVDSEYNVLVALHRITPEDLRIAQAPVREWQRLGHPVPVYFTWRELSEAADVFPIEFRQMERARSLLYGTDPFLTVKLSDVHLRHQTEYELRSKLIKLRRVYIPVSVSAERLLSLMNDSLASFASLFRAVLWLLGTEAPVRKSDCVRETAKRLGLNGQVFERIFELRSSGIESLDLIDANSLF